MEKFLSKSMHYFYKILDKYYLFFLLAIILTASYNIFFNLRINAIYSWDEARHGVSAYEMLKNHNWVVNTYGYENDYWNLKPPLSFIMIILGYKIAGFNPLGLRLFSAFAALLTIIFAALFAKHKHGRIAALTTALVLTSSSQYIIYHCARSGDADSMLVLFFTLSIISLIMSSEDIRWLYAYGLFFSLAFLTKSWHAGNIIIIGFLFILISPIYRKLNVCRGILLLLFSTVPIIVWVIIRYANDGIMFFKDMVDYDLLARSSRSLEGHIGNVWFYFNVFQNNYFYWLTVLVAVFFSYLAMKRNHEFSRSSYYKIAMLLWILVPFILYTKAKTKIFWYILPLYPPMAICIGGFFDRIVKSRNAILQFIVTLAILGSFYRCEGDIKSHISNYTVADTQVTLQKLSKFTEFRGKSVYIIYGENWPYKVWIQSDVLAAELYDDLKPELGGLDEFLKDDDKKSLLIIPRKQSNIIKENKLRIVLEGMDTYILSK